jgi:hypothetical protein
MNKPNEWNTLRLKIKYANAKCPAFQEEFKKVIKNW